MNKSIVDSKTTEINLRKEFLETGFGRNLGITSRMLKQFIKRRLSEAGYDIAPEQAFIIINTWLKDSLNQQQISFIIDRDKTSTTRVIDVMEKEKLVIRVPDKNDRRQNIIKLTKLGDKRRQEIVKILAQLQMDILKDIDPKHIEICKNVLRMVRTNISE